MSGIGVGNEIDIGVLAFRSRYAGTGAFGPNVSTPSAVPLQRPCSSGGAGESGIELGHQPVAVGDEVSVLLGRAARRRLEDRAEQARREGEGRRVRAAGLVAHEIGLF